MFGNTYPDQSKFIMPCTSQTVPWMGLPPGYVWQASLSQDKRFTYYVQSDLNADTALSQVAGYNNLSTDNVQDFTDSFYKRGNILNTNIAEIIIEGVVLPVKAGHLFVIVYSPTIEAVYVSNFDNRLDDIKRVRKEVIECRYKLPDVVVGQTATVTTVRTMNDEQIIASWGIKIQAH